MENLSAVSFASAGSGGCGANRLKRAFDFFFLSPSFVCEIVEGGGAKPWYFTL